ncbi:Nucleotide-binding universal stress protein, UspA family [Haladaptatus litoreus]|uniref:Nucleotide-binding universal stress protein, UspA family n=1 Tax=Haladaptatus litoreus TaxID=553468 RepID=A0A1N6ZLF0_9EURY|nr:universal stress protein [Haladaptatus litoreus]SIR27541.1 Nucleotide-binding universal stress protein, UspA family [Haladaptatus litoreus]
MSLLERVVLPVASEKDAESTCDAALKRIESVGGRVIALHVVEKAGGAPDKASVEQREEQADEIFEIVRERCDALGVPVETKIAYSTDVADAIFETADEADATAIAFTPRGGSRWMKLLTGDVALSLATKTNRPVVILPDGEDD